MMAKNQQSNSTLLLDITLLQSIFYVSFVRFEGL